MGTQAPANWEEQPLTTLPGIGPKRAAQFAELLGARRLNDLLCVLPRKYQDPACWVNSSDWGSVDGERVRYRGQVIKTWLFRPRGRRTVLGVRVEDKYGYVDALFFQQPWLRDRFQPGEELELEGKASARRGAKLLAPRLVSAAGEEVSGLEAVYPESGCLSSGQVAKAVQAAMDALLKSADDAGEDPANWVADPIPKSLRASLDLPALGAAWLALHRPLDREQVEAARRRLAFGEVLRFERARLAALPADGAPNASAREQRVWSRILARIPFALTSDQDAVLATLREELAAGRTIRRLIHGEVGSGKTVVAFAMALALAADGRQSAILAPTEILARQHLRTFQSWLQGSQLRLVRLLGDDPQSMRRAALADLAAGRAQIAVGTHALFGPGVSFADLGLVVLDEQHRFGVRQKGALVEKGEKPHVLTMTATPIPRTLAWAAYGALEPCVLRSRPGSGSEVTTRVHRPIAWRESISAEMAQRAAAGEAAFLVAPRIDGEGGLKALVASLREGPWAKLRIGVVHGRMMGAEIEAQVRGLAEGRLHALAGTTVVEVGLDVADVPQMAIFGAERLGLASLHQLRGRLARGLNARPARCEVFVAGDAFERLQVLEECCDGFQVAETDLRQRGPGLLRGLAQSGHGGFRVFDPIRDGDLVEALRREEIRNWLQDGG
ncbi:MAG: DEAD/DEAH box helicase [Planctomycetes bacterium]|nr:DEAD/DEAH box helicase [Planctomycetota bacterium]